MPNHNQVVPRRRGSLHAIASGVATAYRNRHAIVKGSKAVAKYIKKKIVKKPVRKVKEKNERLRGVSQHSNIGSRSEVIYLKKTKLGGKTKGVFDYSQTNSTIVTSLSGEQGVGFLFGLLTPSQFLTDSGVGYTSTQACVSFFEMQPDQKTTGSGYLPAVANPIDDLIGVKTINLRMEICNFSTVSTVVDVYIVMAKRDMIANQDPVTQWSNALTAQAMGQPAAMTFPTAGGILPGTVGYPSMLDAYQNPKKLGLFNQTWKILKVNHLDMAPGATEIMNSTIVVNRAWKKEVIISMNNESIVYQKGCVVFFAIVRGSLVRDLTAAGNNQATYGSAEVGFVTQERFNLCTIGAGTSNKKVSVAVTNLDANAALANLKQVNAVDVVAAEAEV